MGIFISDALIGAQNARLRHDSFYANAALLRQREIDEFLVVEAALASELEPRSVSSSAFASSQNSLTSVCLLDRFSTTEAAAGCLDLNCNDAPSFLIQSCSSHTNLLDNDKTDNYSAPVYVLASRTPSPDFSPPTPTATPKFSHLLSTLFLDPQLKIGSSQPEFYSEQTKNAQKTSKQLLQNEEHPILRKALTTSSIPKIIAGQKLPNIIFPKRSNKEESIKNFPDRQESLSPTSSKIFREEINDLKRQRAALERDKVVHDKEKIAFRQNRDQFEKLKALEIEHLRNESVKAIRQSAAAEASYVACSNSSTARDRTIELEFLRTQITDINLQWKSSEAASRSTETRLRQRISCLLIEQEELRDELRRNREKPLISSTGILNQKLCNLKGASTSVGSLLLPGTHKSLSQIESVTSRIPVMNFAKKSTTALGVKQRQSILNKGSSFDVLAASTVTIVPNMISSGRKLSGFEVVEKDGTLEKYVFERTVAEGVIERRYKCGTRLIKYNNGTTKEFRSLDKHEVTRYANGDKKTVSPDGMVVYYFAERGVTQTTRCDASVVTNFPDGQQETRALDGTTEIVFPSKVIRVIYPSGAREDIFPDGTVEKVSANGSRTVLLQDGSSKLDETRNPLLGEKQQNTSLQIFGRTQSLRDEVYEKRKNHQNVAP